jgi:hypothetical protein
VSSSPDKSHQLINGYGRQCEIERKTGFTEDGAERQEVDVNKIRSNGQQTVQKKKRVTVLKKCTDVGSVEFFNCNLKFHSRFRQN